MPLTRQQMRGRTTAQDAPHQSMDDRQTPVPHTQSTAERAVLHPGDSTLQSSGRGARKMRLHSTRQDRQHHAAELALSDHEPVAETLIDTLHTCPIPETTRLGRTLRQWRDQILLRRHRRRQQTAAPSSTSSSTRPAAYRPRLPQLTQLPTIHPARITRNPAVPTTTHPCSIPKSRLERSRNSQSSTGSWSVGVPIRWRPAVHG